MKNMKTTKITYLVSLYNDTPINDAYFTTNRLEADLKVVEAIRNGKYGMLIEIVEVENKEFGYHNEVRNLIKEF